MKKLLFLSILLTATTAPFLISAKGEDKDSWEHRAKDAFKIYKGFLTCAYRTPVKVRLEKTHEPITQTLDYSFGTVVMGSLTAPTPLVYFMEPALPPISFLSLIAIPINQGMMQNFYVSTLSKHATGNIFVDGGLINTFTGDGF